MEVEEISRLVGTFIAGVLIFWATQGIRDARAARHAAQQGIAHHESQARRDAQADWATFTSAMQTELSAARATIETLQEQLTTLIAAHSREKYLYEAHIDQLEAHIWQHKDPPPPARPLPVH